MRARLFFSHVPTVSNWPFGGGSECDKFHDTFPKFPLDNPIFSDTISRARAFLIYNMTFNRDKIRNKKIVPPLAIQNISPIMVSSKQGKENRREKRRGGKKEEKRLTSEIFLVE